MCVCVCVCVCVCLGWAAVASRVWMLFVLTLLCGAQKEGHGMRALPPSKEREGERERERERERVREEKRERGGENRSKGFAEKQHGVLVVLGRAQQLVQPHG